MTPQPVRSSKMWHFIRYWVPVFLYCAFIAYLSSQSYPSRHLPTFVFDFSDKLMHGIEFGLLGILLFRAFHPTHGTSRSIGLAIISAVAFAVSDEIHQWFVPHRQADMWDILADTLGATSFVVTWAFFTNHTSLRRQRSS
ncbi:MAG: VanZ family protein [Nitrospirales bacterium]